MIKDFVRVKKVLLIVNIATSITLLSFLIFSSYVYAEIIHLDDDFNDRSKVDMTKTTAEVDTDKGWVTLSPKNLTNSLILYEDSYDMTIINGTKVETYQYQGDKLAKNDALSVTFGLKDPISISSHKAGRYVVLDQELKQANYYQYDGTAMLANPFFTINGLTNPLAVGTVKDNYDVAVLDEKEVKWHSFDGTGMVLNNALSVELGDNTNPISFSQKADSFDYAVVDRANNQVCYYSFEGSSLVMNPLLSITSPSELTRSKSISLSDEGFFYVVVDDEEVKAYNFDGTKMIYNSFLSVSGLKKPISVALKPGSFDYAVLHYDNNDRPVVSYYAFTGTEMHKIPELSITGLQEIPFANDQLLMGKGITTEILVSGIRLVAELDLPAKTQVTWEVTANGEDWLPVTNNDSVRFPTAGKKVNYRAILHTDEEQVAPKILRVKLIDASLWVGNFRITEIVGPSIPGNPELPTSQKVRIWAGYNVTFQVDTTGQAQSVTADITGARDIIKLNSLLGTITPEQPTTEFYNIWQGTFYTDTDVPRGSLLDIAFTTNRDTEFEYASYPGFAMIYDSSLKNHPIHLTH